MLNYNFLRVCRILNSCHADYNQSLLLPAPNDSAKYSHLTYFKKFNIAHSKQTKSTVGIVLFTVSTSFLRLVFNNCNLKDYHCSHNY